MKFKDHSFKITGGIVGGILVGIGVTATVLTGGLAAIGFLAVAGGTAIAMGVVGDVQDYKSKQHREGKSYQLGFTKPLKSLWKERIKSISDRLSSSKIESSPLEVPPPEIPTIQAPNDEEARALSQDIQDLYENSVMRKAFFGEEQPQVDQPQVDLSDNRHESKYAPMRMEQKKQQRQEKPKKEKKSLASRVFGKKRKAP